MNTDTLTGATNHLGGKIKETVGGALGDTHLQAEGKADQLGGTVQKTIGEARDMVEDQIRPLIDYVRQFSRKRPLTAAAVAGVVGLAVINSLRGK